MPGTPESTKKTAATNKLRYGADYYSVIAKKRRPLDPTKPWGFAALKQNDPDRLKRISAKGVLARRRTA